MGAALQLPTYQKVRILNVKSKKTGYEWLQKYSNFKDQNFDANIEMILAEKKRFFSRKQLCVLAVLRQYAVKYGVVNASRNTIIDAVEKQFGFTVCAKTISNLFKKLEKMGIVVVYLGEEYDGSYTSNVVVFNTYEDMKAYEIAQIEAEEAEIERRMMQDLAKTSGVRNYAFNARKWAEEKAQKQAAKEAEEARKVAAAKEAEQKAKLVSLQTRMRAYLEAKKMTTDKTTFNEYRKIVYSTIHKAMQKDSKLTRRQAEDLAYEAFVAMCNVPEKQVKKNRFALLSNKLSRHLLSVVGEYSKQDLQNKRAEALGARIERSPEWMEEHQEEQKSRAEGQKQSPVSSSVIDFEAERRKVLEKLGQ